MKAGTAEGGTAPHMVDPQIPGARDSIINLGDCLDEAKDLADMINKKYGAKVSLITDVGPVIGSHSGPGTMALFFIGKER